MTSEEKIAVKYRGTYYDVVFSPDDGGWFAEAYMENGRTLAGCDTDVFPTASEAEAAIKRNLIEMIRD